MKKTLATCLAIVALFAVAGSAGAITCTVDQRPAATLLIPWFQTTFNPDFTILGTGPNALDTLVTIVNASSAPVIAHVTVFNERSVLVLDFNIALTGFDVQAMSMAQVLNGVLPSTPITTAGASVTADVCQRNSAAPVFPDANGFLRVRPLDPALAEDNSLATALYPVPAYPPGTTPGAGGDFARQVLDSLDASPGSLGCTVGVDGVIAGLIHGYITIDHVNYCTLANPDAFRYYRNDAIGMENTLWGEVIFTSGSGLPTMGGSTVNIEADRAFSQASITGTGAQFNQSDPVRTRTFYSRYWRPSTPVPGENFCTNCVGGGVNNLSVRAPWNQGFGDEREPLGLKYAARYFDGAGITSNWIVWRGSSDYVHNQLINLTGSSTTFGGTPLGACTAVEPVPSLVFFDENERTVTVSGVPLPSPLPPPAQALNIPLETQRIPTAQFAKPPGAIAGWASLSFRSPGGSSPPLSSNLDQAWVEYDINGSTALLSVSAPATQLDPSSCNPLVLGATGEPAPKFPVLTGSVVPVIPGGITGLQGCVPVPAAPGTITTSSCNGTGPAQ